MKALIKTTRHISEEELEEVRGYFPSIEFTVRRIQDRPIPYWNNVFKLIEVDWSWFKRLFDEPGYDIHCYVTDHNTLKESGIIVNLAQYLLDNDRVYEFWIGVPEKMKSRAKDNGFKTNFAWLFVHEMLHGKESFAAQIDRVHEMEKQGRLQELVQEYTNRKLALMEQIPPLQIRVIQLLTSFLTRRYARPLPAHWSKVTQGYLNKDAVTYKQSGVHPGVDFASPLHTPILAPFDGEITRSSYSPSLGNWVEFKFDGRYMVALHCANIQKPGQLKKGEPISFVGSTGLINGIHAHLEGWNEPMNRALLTSEASVKYYTYDITKLIR